MSKKRKPIVAVVGRPNVGKSTLFNALAGQRISIVKDTPGITRDRIYADVTWLDKQFTMIDTGGIEPDSRDIILSQMREQAQIAIDTADVILFMVDVKQGLVDADSKVADMLRRSQKPVVLVVNKVDNFEKYMADTYEFYNLGIGEPHPISAANQLGIGDMLDEVIQYFGDSGDIDEEDDRIRVAIVGKPNVGKSSLINKLIGENRLIVSDIAGTTRDAVDTPVRHNGKDYVFIGKNFNLDKFYKEEALKVFNERLDYIYNLFEEDIPYPELLIGKMTRKWGYCNKNKKLIKLNFELIKYSINEIDYVIIHELSHLIEFNHSKNFWNIVKKYKPDYKESTKVLKEE